MSKETKTWMGLVSSMFVVLVAYAAWRAVTNDKLYLECLEVNRVMLEADPKRINTLYCRN